MPFATTKLLILNGQSLALRQLTQLWRNSPAPNSAETPAYATAPLGKSTTSDLASPLHLGQAGTADTQKQLKEKSNAIIK